jgi:ABC-type multidrug transport system ATPase subunit
MMLFVDIFVYQALAWYIEKVFPGSLGLPQPFYFLLQPSYWRGTTPDQDALNEFDADSAEKDANAREGFYWEAPPATVETSVQIRGLEKVFPNGKRALGGVNLDMHQGTILGLLGHNGAGKSTTMAIMTGLYAPTKGDVKVNGVSVKHDSQGVRKQLGVCLQHNALYENFTVQEHLELFCCLKCVPQHLVKAEVDMLLTATGLTPKRNAPSKALSGGMKRKLSIGIALSGGSPVVTLDEPTAGVDATSRRDIWQMLQSAKATRTILLSTHFMDEADILSDRIAVIAEGQLTAVGSGMSLKRHFADGYMLTVVVCGTSSAPVTAAVRAAVPEATFAGSRGREVSYVLPFGSRGRFPALFEVLQDEKNQASLGIETYGLSAATMEEVFLRASSLHEKGLKGVIRNGPSEPSTGSQPSTGSPPSTESPPPQEREAISAGMPQSDKSMIDVDGAVGALRRATSEDIVSVHSGELNLQNVVAGQPSAEDDRPRSPQCMEQAERLPAPVPKKASATATVSTGLESQQVEDLAPTADRLQALGSSVAEGKLGGVKLEFQQFLALFRKRAISVKRDRKAWASQLLLPACFVLLALVIARIMSVKQESPPVLLTTEMFVGTQGGFGGNKKPGRSTRTAEFNYIPVSDSCHTNQSASLMSAFQGAMTPVDKMQLVDGHMSSHLITNRAQPGFNQAVGAVSIEEHGNTTQVTLWFDNVAYHIIPVMIDFWNNARFRMLGYENVQVRVWNHPLPKTEQLLQDEMSGSSQVFTDLWVAITVILAMGFIPASFVVYLVHEKATSGKHQQLLSGVKPTMYWVSSYFWDMTNFLVPILICAIIFAIFNVEAYAGDNLPAVTVLLLIYGSCMTPMMYCVEPLFSVPSTAYVTLICINIFTGTLSTLSVSVLELYQQEAPELKPVAAFCKAVFPWVLPNYCLGRGMMEIAMNHYMNFVAEEFGLCIPGRGCYVNPLSYDVVGQFLVPLVIMAPVWFMLRIFIEWGFCLGRARKAVSRLRASAPAPKVFDEDADTLAETERVGAAVAAAADQGGSVVDNLVITGLEKSFVTKSRCCRSANLFHAVRGVNVGVPRGECFGLLGVNGAGKTTTMRMITGDTEITSGDVFVGGHSVHTHRDKARQHLGYCPQFDALPDKLTVKETVALYARIRGVPAGRVQQCVQDMIKCMCLEAHQDQCCEYLSGGNKRKLSTALALIGDPDVILLDEPSTGVDVGARRFLWEVIGGLRERGHAIVLTSHAMEECQVLCTRLTIMVHGQFRCLGSPMQLKSKYGGGYTLTIKADLTNDSNQETDTAASACAVPIEADNKSEGSGNSKPFGETILSIKGFMNQMVPEAKLTEQSVGLLRYAIGGQRMPDGIAEKQTEQSQTDIPLAHIFKVFEESTQRGGQLYKCVSDYSISQTSLEEVFLHFSREAERMTGVVAERVATKAEAEKAEDAPVPDSPSTLSADMNSV